jgi:glycosyltransferase involved in cell wall biosynthesis
LLDSVAHIVHTLARRDIAFVIIGSGDLYAETVSRSHALRVDTAVRFTGRIPDQQLLEWLSTADVCVAPDPKDPLNDISSFNKIVEYMAVGKPIVAFDLPEVRIAAGSAAVYAPPNDVVAFAEAIVRLLDAPEQRRAMARAGRERFETTLAWEHQAPRLLALYRDLLGEPA